MAVYLTSATIAMGSVILILIVLLDTFESMLLPRRVPRQLRITRLYYQYSWGPWAALAKRMPPGKRRNAFLSFYGPLSILVLIGLWAIGLIVGFALLHWSLGTEMRGPDERTGPDVYAYFSGVTFFTLGYGDVAPVGLLGRFLAVLEAGIGFGLLAVVISYLPVLYQAFSRREVTISLLDARGGSPPTAAELLGRLARYGDISRLDRHLEEWERWEAEVLESHISFPVLTYYRSQHDNQSWLSALTAILDVSALVVAEFQRADRSQAWLTFAMGRHAVVDLAQTFRTPPVQPDADRLPPERLRKLRDYLKSSGLELRDGDAADRRLAELRGMYEPFVHALSLNFLMPLPPVISDVEPVDNWQTSAWMRRVKGARELAAIEAGDDHED